MSKTKDNKSKDNLLKKLCSNKKLLVITIVILLLVITAITLAVLHFSSNDIVGTWKLVSTSENEKLTKDQSNEYYVFEEPDDNGNGIYYYVRQGAKSKGNYHLTEKDGKDIVTMYYGQEVQYELSGSKLFGNAQLKLILPKGQSKVSDDVYTETFEYSNPPYTKSEYKDYKVDEKLLGKWTSKERYMEEQYSYNKVALMEIEFADNGLMTVYYDVDEKDESYVDMLPQDAYVCYSYTVENNKLKLRQFTDENEYTVSYKIDGDKITFDGDATSHYTFYPLFGDYTYTKAK